MVGLWSEHATTYLLVAGIGTTLAFALPLFFTPLAWARVLRWRVPEDTDLAVYFGRCLGAFALVVDALMLRAALTGIGTVFAFQTIVVFSGLMVIVHVWGAVRRIQPMSETIEIGFWAILVVLALLFYPG